MGAHSTMDKPEWVSRVTPPTTIMHSTIRQQIHSHRRSVAA